MPGPRAGSVEVFSGRDAGVKISKLYFRLAKPIANILFEV
jgi:hypothetical protein